MYHLDLFRDDFADEIIWQSVCHTLGINPDITHQVVIEYDNKELKTYDNKGDEI